MATGGQTMVQDEQQAAALLHKNKIAAERNRPSLQSYVESKATKNTRAALFSPDFTRKAASLEETSWSGEPPRELSQTGGNRAEEAESTLPNEQRYAAELHRVRIAQEIRRDSLDLPAFGTYVNGDPEFDRIVEGLEEENAALRDESANRDVSQLAPLRAQSRQLANEGRRMVGEKVKDYAREKSARLAAKVAGHGVAEADAAASWADLFIFGAIATTYNMIRGGVTVLVPEPDEDAPIESVGEAANYLGKKALFTVIPPYRPLKEPGDFLLFLFEIIVVGAFALLIVVIMLITYYEFANSPLGSLFDWLFS